MDLAWWYVSRASGIVSALAMLGAVVGGMSYSARNTGVRFRPSWWLRSHSWLAGVAVAATAIHLAAVYVDGSYGVGLVDLAVPGLTPWALSWGVVALYLLGVGVATSWPRRSLAPRRWRLVHLGMVIATVVAGVHGWQSGTDATAQWWQAVLTVGGGAAAFAISVRLLMIVVRKRAGRDAAGRPAGGGAEARDRARVLALLGATGAVVGLGTMFSSLDPVRSSRFGSPLGQRPRGAQDFDGEVVGTPFGPVQVRARFQGGRLTDIASPSAPFDLPLSSDISTASLPELRSEALQMQSAEVDAVTGASYTSTAYQESLQAAIDRARAAGATTLR